MAVCAGILPDLSRTVQTGFRIPYRQQGIAIISVVLDAPQDAISSLSGKLGMLNGVSAKTVYSRKTIQS